MLDAEEKRREAAAAKRAEREVAVARGELPPEALHEGGKGGKKGDGEEESDEARLRRNPNCLLEMIALGEL